MTVDLDKANAELLERRKAQPAYTPQRVTSTELKAAMPRATTHSPDSRWDAARELAADQERRRRAELWRNCGIPRRHRETIDSGGLNWPDENREPVNRAREVVSAGGLLLLLGPWGTGKTQLAAALCKYVVLTTGRDARYRRFADLLSEMRQECYTNGGSDAQLMRRLSRIGLLVVDEVHHRRWTQDEELWLLRLLDHRYGEKAPTVLIANLTPDEMRSALNPAIVDRMFEAGAVVELLGESKRRGMTPPTPLTGTEAM